jgi:hypothetical protein
MVSYLQESERALRAALQEADRRHAATVEEAELAERRADERTRNYQKLLTDERARLREVTDERDAEKSINKQLSVSLQRCAPRVDLPALRVWAIAASAYSVTG